MCPKSSVIATREEYVVCNHQITLDRLSYCIHIESGTQMLLLARNVVAGGYKFVMIIAKDTGRRSNT